jgi:hypothetical protein
MRLAAIYNVWDGAELLKGSMDCLKYQVDDFIIVWQDISNFGERYNPLDDVDLSGFKNVVLNKYYPTLTAGGMGNERAKRNIGITIAKTLKCTHFLNIDVDEYYEDFADAKQKYLDSGADGSVCKLYTYFKTPTLRFESPDNYYVPFIHKLDSNTIVGVNNYPFYVDPTRMVNETDVVELPIFMHHYSWVRKDINRKANNSSARHNIERSNLLFEYNSDLKEGSYADGGRKLISVENKFRIEI